MAEITWDKGVSLKPEVEAKEVPFVVKVSTPDEQAVIDERKEWLTKFLPWIQAVGFSFALSFYTEYGLLLLAFTIPFALRYAAHIMSLTLLLGRTKKRVRTNGI